MLISKMMNPIPFRKVGNSVLQAPSKIQLPGGESKTAPRSFSVISAMKNKMGMSRSGQSSETDQNNGTGQKTGGGLSMLSKGGGLSSMLGKVLAEVITKNIRKNRSWLPNKPSGK